MFVDDIKKMYELVVNINFIAVLLYFLASCTAMRNSTLDVARRPIRSI